MSDFWARKLAGQQAPARQAPPPTVGSAWWQSQGTPHQESQFRPQANPEVATSSKARSSRETETCPECASTNYMRPGVDPKLGKRCYDCGYPLIQSGSGISGTGNEPQHEAKQLARVKNSVYSGAIFDHIR